MISINDSKIQKYLTPYKYNKPVLEASGKHGAFDEKSIDIPFVFKHNEKYWMLYAGFDGKGYQTALATSENLLDWQFSHLVLPRLANSGRWDEVGAAGTWIIKESDSYNETPSIKKIDGKYWMVYHSYPQNGYEAGPAEIGMAYCENDDLTGWERLKKPAFSWRDGAEWEHGGLYKACIIRNGNKWQMYYNAKDCGEPWVEQTGMAYSDDLVHWERCEENPVLKVTPDSWNCRFVSDPYIVKDADLWLNFFFGYGQNHAMEGLAISSDGICWDKVNHPIIKNGNLGDIDEGHAHKASIFIENGRLYHFYCATRPPKHGDKSSSHGEFRCITVASDKPFKKKQECT